MKVAEEAAGDAHLCRELRAKLRAAVQATVAISRSPRAAITAHNHLAGKGARLVAVASAAVAARRCRPPPPTQPARSFSRRSAR